jgi:hypothetical protein
MLVLLIKLTEGMALRWLRVIYIPSFLNSDACIQAVLRFSLRNFRSCNVGDTERQDL